MNILITGGSGFIGTHLINFLLKEYPEAEILNIDIQNSSISNRRLNTTLKDIRTADVANFDIKDSFDICIHLAALCKEPGFEWEEYFETNHLGTVNILNLCEKLGIENIIFASTMMVYKAGEIQKIEGDITAPDTAYGISKLLAEKDLERWRDQKVNRSLKIIRPAVVFGENENANFTRLFHSLKSGFFPFVGKSSTVKANIYVKEVVLFIQFLINEKPQVDIFNLAFPENNEMKKIINDFKKVFNFRPVTPVLPYELLLFVSYFTELLNGIGLKNSIHHRRIQKLYYSTDIFPKAAIDSGYKFKYDFKSALEDWKASGDLD